MHEPVPLDGRTGPEAIKRPSSKWGYAVGLVGAAIYLLIGGLGDPGRGRAAAVAVTAVCGAAWFRWDLRGFRWFWAVLAIMLVLHALVVALVPWPAGRGPMIALLPVALIDFSIINGSVKLAERMWGNPRPSGGPVA